MVCWVQYYVGANCRQTNEHDKAFNVVVSTLVTDVLTVDMQHPTSLIQQKKPDLLKEPCTVTWDVMWDDLKTMELFHAKEESRQMPPSRLVIRVYTNESRRFDTKETNFVVKCHPGTKQAVEIRNAIQQAVNTYGPGRASNSTQVLTIFTLSPFT